MKILSDIVKKYERFIKLTKIKGNNEVICVNVTINDVLIYDATEAEAQKYCNDAVVFHDGVYIKTEVEGKTVYAWRLYANK